VTPHRERELIQLIIRLRKALAPLLEAKKEHVSQYGTVVSSTVAQKQQSSWLQYILQKNSTIRPLLEAEKEHVIDYHRY
jgi:hypothetical protein